jgi:hypothetical protein
MPYLDIAGSVQPAGMPTVRAMPADQSVKAAFDCLNRILSFDENPNLNHGTSLGVF